MEGCWRERERERVLVKILLNEREESMGERVQMVERGVERE